VVERWVVGLRWVGGCGVDEKDGFVGVWCDVGLSGRGQVLYVSGGVLVIARGLRGVVCGYEGSAAKKVPLRLACIERAL
jgi:hypothetical protein